MHAYRVVELDCKLLRSLDEEADVGENITVNLGFVGSDFSRCEALELGDFHLRGLAAATETTSLGCTNLLRDRALASLTSTCRPHQHPRPPAAQSGVPSSRSFTFLPFFSFVTVLVSLFVLPRSVAGDTQLPIGGRR